MRLVVIDPRSTVTASLADLHLSRADGGMIVSATFAGFMVGAVVTGKLADVYGRRTLLIANILLFSAAAALACSGVMPGGWTSFMSKGLMVSARVMS